jgi:hypothetical protein
MSERPKSSEPAATAAAIAPPLLNGSISTSSPAFAEKPFSTP